MLRCPYTRHAACCMCASGSKRPLSFMVVQLWLHGRLVTIQPYPFISCRIVPSDNSFWLFPTTYFMSGVRPIKSNIQNALCEQAPNSILYIQFCMAELLQNIIIMKFILTFTIITYVLKILVCSPLYLL